MYRHNQVQYYNGEHNPRANMQQLCNSYSELVGDVFAGDASRIVVGFCINVCSRHSISSDEALAALITLQAECNGAAGGGAFFWANSHNVGGSWAHPISEYFKSAVHTDVPAERLLSLGRSVIVGGPYIGAHPGLITDGNDVQYECDEDAGLLVHGTAASVQAIMQSFYHVIM